MEGGFLPINFIWLIFRWQFKGVLRRQWWGGNVEVTMLRRQCWGGNVEEAMLRRQCWGGNLKVAMFRTRFSVDQLSPPHPAKNSSFIIFARTSIKGTVSTSTSVVEPKIFIFGSGSILVPYFGSGYSYSSSSSHILPLKTVLHITVIIYQWRNKLVFLHPSRLQTGCSKYLYIKR